MNPQNAIQLLYVTFTFCCYMWCWLTLLVSSVAFDRLNKNGNSRVMDFQPFIHEQNEKINWLKECKDRCEWFLVYFVAHSMSRSIDFCGIFFFLLLSTFFLLPDFLFISFALRYRWTNDDPELIFLLTHFIV